MAAHAWIATEDDANVVVELMIGFRDWWGYAQPSDEQIRATVTQLLGDPMTDYLLAAPAPGGAPAGVCQLRYRLSVWTGADDCWLEDLYVRADGRRGGVGRALVEAAVERARARGCRRIELDVNEQNADALAFYRRLGFTTEPKPPGRTLFIARRLDR
jgi:ribosomal protein S18 acetylase RimI-like enzyme